MASSSFKGIAVSVSDEESDEPAKVRVRVRQKRKKTVIRVSGGIWRRIVRKVVRWWPVLIILPTFAVLFFEISRVTWKSGDVGKKVELVDDQKPHGNLNRLDPTTRVVNGVREPCLKILRPEEIDRLEFPAGAESNFPVKKVLYKSASGVSYDAGDNVTLLHEHTDHDRFNLFTGKQTLHEREECFKRDGGFRISGDDKSFMQTCEAVVSTCAFGGGDDLYQPIGMTEASLRRVCYVAFWDEVTLAAQEAEGRGVGGDGMVGKWRVVLVRELPFSDQRLNGKIPKMLSHRLFPRARYSIWVDAKSQFRRDPVGVLEALLWRGGAACVFDEGRAVVKKNKASPQEVELQLTQYRRDGFTAVKRFGGKKALAEASVIVREHTAATNLLMCVWFNEVVRFTSRDQLSFPYVLRRLNLSGVNMFPVCTRKDLVNSMGHRRKARPLPPSRTAAH
ncbi:unnamed protein product [Spirodela intermedia]|uniref:TOD1/MUCI70 glycosyltransferase-like domain-containing protein n=1 Tax=Spirodela intermedia TaxID=51605 RepID=A0A7I8IJP6_SPIIN|nr:unnamed protein product [Spirodela intermedia]CAA6657721.1 unnamed protein product [Spirodela intermedia]